ncbi:hypothetical protein ACHBGV_05935 [Streptococcus sp. A34]|uniref:hypothetical protein n=1 Tax=Streptococcus sp. A34 TaxID=3373130 RepID=UPI001552592A|nr:hypothetical protein [Streptococcus suis]
MIKIYGNFTVKNSAIDNFYNFYQAMPDAAKSQYGLIKIYDDPMALVEIPLDMMLLTI